MGKKWKWWHILFSWAPKSLRMVIAAMKLIIMFGCESWTIKKTEHQRIDAFELWCWRSLLKVPWTSGRSNQSILKEITGRTDAEALILRPSDAKSWLIGKDPDAGKDWEQEEKGVTEWMVGWHHWLNGHEFEQTPGDSEEQASLVCYSPGVTESHMT